ncbi:MAG: PDZ domain-containing protein [Phycisphaerales bacterium]|nr:PDZ domain-containing protein [Phycisphaerales bacterium]
MNSISSNRARLAGAVSVLAILAGSALAQSGVEGSLDQPVKSRGSEGQGRSQTTIMKAIEGDNTYEVSIVNGATTAKINGKKVPEDRIRRSPGKIELLDKGGDVVHTFSVGGNVRAFGFGEQGGQPFRVEVAPEGGQWRQGPGEGGAFQAAEPPPVMLGVTMSDPSDEDREQNDLAEGKGIRIDRVIDGLPADKAGLKAGDIVLSVNGKPAGPDDLRSVLKEKEAGDTITLRVVRDGDKETIKVELAKYDPEKLGNTVMGVPAMPGGQGADAQQWQQMQEQMQKMFGQGGPGGGKGQFHGRVLGVQPGQDMQWFTFPGDQGKRLDELSERLEKLDARMDDLSRKLEKLSDSLRDKK